MKGSLLAIFVALCVLSKVLAGRGDSRPLNDKEIADLTEIYGLKQSPFGAFLLSETYKSEATINLTSGPAHIGSSYIILINGVCEAWIVFPESVRVYTRISGKATMDLASPDGEITPVCIGDSLADPNCVYTLIVPAGWKTNFIPSDHFIFTGTVIGGSVTSGEKVSFETMREEYSAYTDLIDQVEADCS